ncbi:hypothetical protein Pvag_2952 [Pantoea vagans C9-1]|nr:hypothetical protein Pvag_2952 [Pantoea vagans C9-1]
MIKNWLASDASDTEKQGLFFRIAVSGAGQGQMG